MPAAPEWRRTKARGVVPVLVMSAGAILATGCTSGSSEQPPAELSPGAGDLQRRAVEDGSVTFEEYEAGLLRFADCMESGGHPLADVQFDEATQLYDYLVAGEAVDGGLEDDCYIGEFQDLDRLWQTNEDRPGPRSPSVDDVLRACLDAIGVEAPIDAPSPELEDLALENGLSLQLCADQAVRDLEH